ncbi:MAG: hypothetical protein KDD21_02195 [Bacteroidetes bacterium]|nr:hypothetical protein [Bacteroidota bacterium]
MKNKKLPLFIIALVAISFMMCISCTPEPTEYDETGYTGTFYGHHYLADSAQIRIILNDPGADMIYADTFDITNGTSATDGKLDVKSHLLGNSTIQLDITNGKVTPVFLGDISILGTTLQDSKLTSGSATWNATKDSLNTQLFATVTYNYNGTPINIPDVEIVGKFDK